ncbi:MAG: hypothetical protein BWK79_19140 [Beggiatoa sp. IS2]|nr:MAG: hypothetical protein BWK79_19140 [Beggiatoa sp. IS2]
MELIFKKYRTEITAQLKFLPAELLFVGMTELDLQPSLKNFSGDLYDIQWSSNLTIANWRLKAKFNQLTAQLEELSSSETINPRTLQVQDLDGQVEVTANSGQISMNTGTIRWSDARLYSHPFVLQELKGEMSWQRAIRSTGTQRLHRGIRRHEWQLRTEGIRAVDQNSSLLFVGNITIPLDGSVPESDLTITVNGGQLAQLHRYIPDNRLPYLAQWLKTALVSGQLHTANITVQGAINQLLTGKDKGFGLRAVVKNLHFNYAPHWPPFDDLDAEILINHQQLTVVTRSGTLLRKKIKEVSARVENLYSHTPLLYLEGQLQSTLVDSLQFIRESPLHRIMNFDHLELAGTIELDLKMAMSLPKIQLNSIAGQISLKDTTLTEKSTGLTLEKMKGLIHFDRNTVTSEKIDGELFGKPIRLSFVKKLDDPQKPLSIQLNGPADSDFIHRQWVHFSPSAVDFPLSAIISGDTAWRATLEVTQPLEGQNIHLYVETDFTGLAIDLPAPFKKTKDTPWTSHLDLHFSMTGKDTLQIQCGPILQGMFLIENKVLERGSLWLGATQSLQIVDTSGISVIGHLTDFSVTAWRDWFSTTLTTPKVIPQNTENNLSWLGDLNLSFDHFEVLGQTFTKLTIRRQRQTTQWKILLNSAELEGYLTFNRDPKIPSLNLVFERLTLMTPRTLKEEPTAAAPPLPQEETPEPIDLRQLPAIAFHCSALQIGEINLGNVNFYTQPTEEGLQIDLFEAKAAHFSVQAKGQWQHRQQQTSIELNLHGDNVGQLLSRFGYRSLPLVGQKTQVNLTATWPGPPHAFKLATVKAGLDLVIINGQILTVEPGAAGRLFGLFDLQALPRRLTLDFRDVFSAGFGFDSISGNFVMGEGRAYTENLVLQSPVAHILIQGYTDLIHKNFDQTAIVIPHVSNALPVAGALAGGLSIGAIVLVVQKILQAEIEKAVNYQYSIKGSWAKPEVVSVFKESSKP